MQATLDVDLRAARPAEKSLDQLPAGGIGHLDDITGRPGTDLTQGRGAVAELDTGRDAWRRAGGVLEEFATTSRAVQRRDNATSPTGVTISKRPQPAGARRRADRAARKDRSK
jgi:hypothetical protein